MAGRKSSRARKPARRPAVRKGAKKSSRAAAKKSPARKPSLKRPSAKKATARKKSASSRRPASAAKKKSRKSPIQRVTSVARQVAQQAQAAVVGGVEALREMGENIVERVGDRMGGERPGGGGGTSAMEP